MRFGSAGRSLEVVDLPAGEMRAGDVPLLALAVRRQDERAFARAHETRTPLIAVVLSDLLAAVSTL